MTSLIKTDEYSERLRQKAISLTDKRILIARLAGSDQEQDLTVPPNCQGFGRIRHFRRLAASTGVWPANPLPIDPAAAALGLPIESEVRAQVFQNAACNWRCWYCFVPFRLLEANSESAAWLSADELISLYLQEPEPNRARMIDLTGGQPDLTPEWIPWTMQAMRDRGIEGDVYLWSDDNLSTDYFWKFLSPTEQEIVATFKNYGRVGCFKGFDQDSFSFNTKAEPNLFERQFDIFKRMTETGIDLYAYATFTARDTTDISDKIARFVDRLQFIDENLPLRTVPLQVYPFKVVKHRVDSAADINKLGQLPYTAQGHAIEAWQKELTQRFPSTMREKRINTVPMKNRRSTTTLSIK
ncbi:hypothetical protein JYK02_06890 [Corallococcus macrosporus]|uniref:Radical SAM protein n=1 Tax=Corallococcus macrosporus TaxID=35 RepID=A0ABS3D879_9BACT|nr:hypothetical protein [Corallococcus macrosporus]MBN8227236.1 hypothetical protein [Corallococcus macrosporus]